MPPKKSKSKGGKKSKKKADKKKSKSKSSLPKKKSDSGGESDSQKRDGSRGRTGSAESVGSDCMDCPLPPPVPSCRRSKNSLQQRPPSYSQSAPNVCPTQAALSSPSAICPGAGSQFCATSGTTVQGCQSQAFLAGGGGGGCRSGPGPSILNYAGPSMMSCAVPGPSIISCGTPIITSGGGSCGGSSMMSVTRPQMMSCAGPSVTSGVGSCGRSFRTRDAVSFMTRNGCSSSHHQAPIIVCSPSQLMTATLMATNGEIQPATNGEIHPSYPPSAPLPDISASPGLMFNPMTYPSPPTMSVPPSLPLSSIPPAFLISQAQPSPQLIAMGIEGLDAQTGPASYHQMMPQRCQSLGQIQNYFPSPQSNMQPQEPPCSRQSRQVEFLMPSSSSVHSSQYSLRNAHQ